MKYGPAKHLMSGRKQTSGMSKWAPISINKMPGKARSTQQKQPVWEEGNYLNVKIIIIYQVVSKQMDPLSVPCDVKRKGGCTGSSC